MATGLENKNSVFQSDFIAINLGSRLINTSKNATNGIKHSDQSSLDYRIPASDEVRLN
ncbi:hypothetical protein [Sodalis endosymbiont of Henestaris halophilus]|uniref:hypothetical protein n=1 Tax=Sodalis endosymbiont of Henestaris halophilus TaxID=1929246 RepID=UPI0012FD4E40|nr:hypothetical protein [Sodalis endosymbiont of Henestaris halophilus]